MKEAEQNYAAASEPVDQSIIAAVNEENMAHRAKTLPHAGTRTRVAHLSRANLTPKQGNMAPSRRPFVARLKPRSPASEPDAVASQVQPCCLCIAGVAFRS